jgi:beta-aspartyl-peptidase (threonine type)
MAADADRPAWVIAVHGGAGGIDRSAPPAHEAGIRLALADALRAGGAVLARGGASLDAVEAAVVLLEDSPLFNAGRGAVFTADGTNELDAAIMDGAGLRTGAVAGVRRVRNPVRAARAVMEHSPHVFLYGDGAEAFARTQSIELVDPSYFRTEERWQQLERARREATLGRAARAKPADDHFGTVGAVALDAHGNLAAATSTGGLTNKRYGRIGDSPVIGAGTYADNRSCAVSATGEGEFFIRLAAARTLCAAVEFAGASVDDAARDVIQRRLTALGGKGAVIVLAPDGTVAMAMNTGGMSRGSLAAGSEPVVKLYADE